MLHWVNQAKLDDAARARARLLGHPRVGHLAEDGPRTYSVQRIAGAQGAWTASVRWHNAGQWAVVDDQGASDPLWIAVGADRVGTLAESKAWCLLHAACWRDRA